MALLIAPAYASHALDTTKLLLNQALEGNDGVFAADSRDHRKLAHRPEVSRQYLAIPFADPSHFVTFRTYTTLPAAAPEAQAH
jgi:hypothetical protein